jgi:hypothetical protein
VSLERDPAKARAWEQRSRERAAERARAKPRKRLPAKSERKAAAAPDEAKVREAVYARDRGCQLAHLVGQRDSAGTEVPRCHGPRTPHHRRKAIEGGAYSVANRVELCLGHNGWVEDEPDAAAELAPLLVMRSGDAGYAQLGRRAQREAG